jgi:glycosyltransferase involved in cell wall biosynthesis
VNCLVADTPELFTQSVEWLLTDSRLCERISRSARETVEKKYSLDESLRRFEKIIKSVVEIE